MKKDYLILAAYEPEIKPARELLADYANFYFASTGIGLVDSAIGATRAITSLLKNGVEAKNLELIFIGSAGTIKLDIPLLTVVSAESICLVDSDLLSGKTYLPEKISAEPTDCRGEAVVCSTANQPESSTKSTDCRGEAPSSPAITISLAGLPHRQSSLKNYRFWTSLGITAELKLAEEIKLSTGAECENMELFSVARAAKEFSIPCSSINCITNYLNENAHNDWKKNKDKAAEITAAALYSWVQKSD